MANIIPTIFQRLNQILTADATGNIKSQRFNLDRNEILRTDDKVKYDSAKLQAQQNKYLNNAWKKVENGLMQQSINYETSRIGSYADFEQMEYYPLIGSALDIMAEESCTLNGNGRIINVYSDSKRIKGIIEDLLYNRLDIHTSLPMWTRSVCKYGDNFLLLKLDENEGVVAAKQLPNFEMERREGDLYDKISSGQGSSSFSNSNKVKFYWRTNDIEFNSLQIAHFRLLGDDRRLPYGTSLLEKARRIWKQIILAEDSMLTYRVTRAPERRVFKVFVGNIDNDDVPAYIDQIANRFKRTSVVDPQTGQMDLRYNQMPVWKNSPIPLLDGRTITIEELSNEWKNDKENYVYSVQDNTHQIVGGKVIWCDKNYTAKRMVKVTLDDGTYVVTAEEHPFILRDGSTKRADELSENDSLMPFYRDEKAFSNRKDSSKYERVYNPNNGKYEFTHRLIAKEIEKNSLTDNTIHHINFNSKDNSFQNLVWVDYRKHITIETRIIERGFETITGFISDNKKNHKVKSIEFIQGDDVYCMTVVGPNGEDDRHNFATLSLCDDNSISTSGLFLKNSNDQDIFVPVRSESAQNPIDTLPGAQNLDAISDIEYLQSNLFTALRVPKPFLGFDDAAGDGKNLALQDIRFSRTINRVQQSMLQELNKIVVEHLYLCGFHDDLDNFSLTLNNPSTQAEMLKVEHQQVKVTLYKDSVSDAGNGFGATSMTRAKREIFGWSDDDIKQDLLEQRMEKAAAAELESTSKIIKHTGLFDTVDRVYGDYEKALNGGGEPSNEEGNGSEGGSGGLGGGFGGGGLGGDDLDFSEEGEGEEDKEGGNTEGEGGEFGGNEEGGTEPNTDEEAPDNAEPTEDTSLKESVDKTIKILTEHKENLKKDYENKKKKYSNIYFERLLDVVDNKKNIQESTNIINNQKKMKGNIHSMLESIDEILKK